MDLGLADFIFVGILYPEFLGTPFCHCVCSLGKVRGSIDMHSRGGMPVVADLHLASICLEKMVCAPRRAIIKNHEFCCLHYVCGLATAEGASSKFLCSCRIKEAGGGSKDLVHQLLFVCVCVFVCVFCCLVRPVCVAFMLYPLGRPEKFGGGEVELAAGGGQTTAEFCLFEVFEPSQCAY